MSKPEEREILTLDEVAARLHCSRPTVCKLATEGGLPSFRVGKLWRFRLADVRTWEAQQAKKGAA